MSETKIRNSDSVILLCLSASPSNQRVIRTAAKALNIPGSEGIALYIESRNDAASGDTQLRENIETARRLGFKIQALESGDIVMGITEYARRVKATDLYLGWSPPSFLMSAKKPLSDQLVSALPEVDIHVIPDMRSSAFPQISRRSNHVSWNLRDLLLVLAVMAAATFLCLLIDRSRYSNANIITIYILGVLIASLLTSHQIYGLLAAVLYILLFNFLFIEPRYSLLVYDPEYLMTYLVTVIASLLTSSLATRVKTIARRSAENAYQAKILLDTSKQLEQAAGSSDLIRITCDQLSNLLDRTVIFFHEDGKAPSVFPAAEENADQIYDLSKEREAVEWTKANLHYSGAYTSHFGNFRYQYLSIHIEDRRYGVLAIDMKKKPLSDFESTLLHSILHEFSMAMDHEKMQRERQLAEVFAEKERMRAGLLRSVSHDLRTPLTAIYGNACNLAGNSSVMTQEDRDKTYADIREDSLWLIEQMENILSMTKLESDPSITLSAEDIADVIEESLRHISDTGSHRLQIETGDAPLFAMMDPKLITQVLVNLINNALKYTPEGSEITVRSWKEDGRVFVSVSDNGPGIPDEDKKNIFDLFYTGSHSYTDAVRSMGIGLNVCAMIMKAHGGTITVSDAEPHGTVFTFSLSAKEVNGYE